MIHNNNKCQNWIDFVKVEVYSWSLSLNLKKTKQIKSNNKKKPEDKTKDNKKEQNK